MNHSDHTLLQKAIEAQQKAYSPYSGFSVGAAVLTGSKKIYSGCNIENSSYGLTVCAERVALFKAVSEGETQMDAIAIVGDSAEPLPPCGACRQVMAEFNPNMRVLMAGRDHQITIFSLAELYPNPFLPEKLEKK